MGESAKNSILIIDDEKMVIMALTEILSPKYTIYAVKDGLDALEKAKEFLPDLILLDIVMPEMDGHAVIAALKNTEKTKEIPVIIISSLSNIEDEKKGLALGAVDYITKPFYPDIVKLRVQNQIRLINQTRQIIKNETAVKSSHSKIDFLLRMSHEMLTPMNAIIGMTQIAKMANDPKKVKECLSEIDSASRCLLDFISELLEVSAHNVSSSELDTFIENY